GVVAAAGGEDDTAEKQSSPAATTEAVARESKFAERAGGGGGGGGDSITPPASSTNDGTASSSSSHTQLCITAPVAGEGSNGSTSDQEVHRHRPSQQDNDQQQASVPLPVISRRLSSSSSSSSSSLSPSRHRNTRGESKSSGPASPPETGCHDGDGDDDDDDDTEGGDSVHNRRDGRSENVRFQRSAEGDPNPNMDQPGNKDGLSSSLSRNMDDELSVINDGEQQGSQQRSSSAAASPLPPLIENSREISVSIGGGGGSGGGGSGNGSLPAVTSFNPAATTRTTVLAEEGKAQAAPIGGGDLAVVVDSSSSSNNSSSSRVSVSEDAEMPSPSWVEQQQQQRQQHQHQHQHQQTPDDAVAVAPTTQDEESSTAVVQENEDDAKDGVAEHEAEREDKERSVPNAPVGPETKAGTTTTRSPARKGSHFLSKLLAPNADSPAVSTTSETETAVVQASVMEKEGGQARGVEEDKEGGPKRKDGASVSSATAPAPTREPSSASETAPAEGIAVSSAEARKGTLLAVGQASADVKGNGGGAESKATNVGESDENGTKSDPTPQGCPEERTTGPSRGNPASDKALAAAAAAAAPTPIVVDPPEEIGGEIYTPATVQKKAEANESENGGKDEEVDGRGENAKRGSSNSAAGGVEAAGRLAVSSLSEEPARSLEPAGLTVDAKTRAPAHRPVKLNPVEPRSTTGGASRADGAAAEALGEVEPSSKSSNRRGSRVSDETRQSRAGSGSAEGEAGGRRVERRVSSGRRSTGEQQSITAAIRSRDSQARGGATLAVAVATGGNSHDSCGGGSGSGGSGRGSSDDSSSQTSGGSSRRTSRTGDSRSSSERSTRRASTPSGASRKGDNSDASAGVGESRGGDGGGGG
ncbi:unnamed protein product, partial [Pylaiella littoralis]